MPTDTELAWAAGFWDGEGCCSFFVCRSRLEGRRAMLRGTITQKDPRALYRFRDIIGFGSINGPYDGTYRYSAGGPPRVVKLATLLWPYLGIVKKQQFNRCIRSLRDYRHRN